MIAVRFQGVGAVVIGRNEGVRLKRCLESVRNFRFIVYVDSGSTDGSAEWASQFGARVVALDTSIPFTAARARNSGLRSIREHASYIKYVQFVDGDCELIEGWPEAAVKFLEMHGSVSAVCGRLRERNPDGSFYNWLCEQEWDRPAGPADHFGGIVLMRRDAVEAVGGFREDIIAGEEPELSVRLRAAGWAIWRLGNDMATHDAAILHFRQWWKRMVRSGYAFAVGSHLHGARPERHFVWEARRAWLWGAWLPIGCIWWAYYFWPWGLLAGLVYPLQILRQIMRNPGPPRERATLAFFQMLARFAEVSGQVRFTFDRLLRRQSKIMEYK